MSGRIVNIETSAHQAVQELLPWFVLDKLDSTESDMVREHLAGCPQCRADADWQRKLRAAEPEPATAPDLGAAWMRMQDRLDAAPARQAPARSSKGASLAAAIVTVITSAIRRLIPERGAWMPWALAAQFGIIAGLSLMVAHLDGESAAYRAASFHALGTPDNTAGNIMVMFRPDTSEQELRGLLQASGARVVDGPTATGVYLLNVDDGRLAMTVKSLRAQHEVTLVEPLVAGAAP
jgi:hypothetical protein